jgi:hypothetical protein
MPQWGTSEASSNSVLWAAQQLNLAPNTSNRDNLFNNTTSNAFISGVTVGQFAVDSNEIEAADGSIAHTGWVLRTVGQGGRAGRVITEVLVAGGVGSDAEDTVYPDYTIIIVTQPQAASANTTDSEEAVFTVVATSRPNTALSYQWSYANGDTIQSGANVGNTTTSTLTVNSAVETANVSYKVTISATGATTVVSANAVLTITT